MSLAISKQQEILAGSITALQEAEARLRGCLFVAGDALIIARVLNVLQEVPRALQAVIADLTEGGKPSDKPQAGN